MTLPLAKLRRRSSLVLLRERPTSLVEQAEEHERRLRFSRREEAELYLRFYPSLEAFGSMIYATRTAVSSACHGHVSVAKTTEYISNYHKNS